MPIVLDGTAGITTPPIVLSSTALGSAVVGELEYDGKVPYFTPQGLQRGIVPGMQYYRLDSALVGANATGGQAFLGAGVTLSSNTVYAFEAIYAHSKSAGTTAHTVSLLFGGTATINNIGYWMQSQGDNNGFTALPMAGTLSQMYIQTASAVVVTGSITVATTYRLFLVRGTVSINAGGTFIPQYQLSAAPGGAYTVALGAYFLIYPISTSGSNTSVGTWA